MSEASTTTSAVSLALTDYLNAMPPDAAADLQYLFDEQAGRLEFDSGFARADAERLALAMLPQIVNDLAGGVA